MTYCDPQRTDGHAASAHPCMGKVVIMFSDGAYRFARGEPNLLRDYDPEGKDDGVGDTANLAAFMKGLDLNVTTASNSAAATRSAAVRAPRRRAAAGELMLEGPGEANGHQRAAAKSGRRGGAGDRVEEILLRAHSQQAEGTGGRAALDLFLSPPSAPGRGDGGRDGSAVGAVHCRNGGGQKLLKS